MKNLLLLPLALLAACASTHDGMDGHDMAYGDDAATMEAGYDGDEMAEAFGEMTEASAAFIAPSEAHAEIAKLAGEWTANMKMFYAPEAPPMETTFDSKMHMMLGGRYLVEEVSGDMMGEAFEGFMVLGHNNGTGETFSVWFDNFGTGITSAAGQRDEAGVLHQTGLMQHAEAPSGSVYRSEMTVIDDDHFNVKMWGAMPDGSESLMMDMDYTRKPGM